MILLIACGNKLRQDDGAGFVLAQRLAANWQANGLPIRHLAVQQLVPELALEIAADDVQEVWFVDSRQASDPTDSEVRIRQLGEANHSPAMGHQMSPELLLSYARQLFDRRPPEGQPPAWQITLPGFQYDFSNELSSECQLVLDGAVGHVAKWRQKKREGKPGTE